MRAPRRILRTAALATGAIAALVLPPTAASATSPSPAGPAHVAAASTVPAPDAPLLAAGGGMATLGAAGLGYAVRLGRRGG